MKGQFYKNFSVEMNWIDIRDKCHRVAMTRLLCHGLNLPVLWCIIDFTMTLSIMMSSGVASNEHVSATMDRHSVFSLKSTLLILTEWYCNIICPCFICFFFPLFHRNLSLPLDVKTPPAFIIQINEISVSLILSAFTDESDC